MSIASIGTQLATSRLSVKVRPSRIIGMIDELRRRNSRLVIDSAAISHDSTKVMPPANNVASDRVACAIESWTTRLPANGIFNRVASTRRRPASVRDQRNRTTAPPMKSGPNHKTLDESHFESPNTICVTVGSSVPNPAKRSDILGTTYTVRKVTIHPDANNRK